ncbi:MAG: LPS export ABC transporter permease LptF [Nitrospiraceae bacterium]|nr:MAG: LPS export ABC transporter permease LptF [Nitrospiraceae bacterium]
MIIHKTIFRELLANTVVIIVSLSVILFMEKFVRLTRLFMGKGADLADIVRIFVYLQPSILLLSIPMSILIAIFLTYGRMGTDSETVVLKASGMSFFGISGPAIVLSAALCIVLLFISLYLLPRGMHAFKKTLYETIVRKASMTFEEESFSDVFKGTVIYVKDIPSSGEFRGIFVYRDADNSVKAPLTIVSESGTITSSAEEGLIKLTMNNGLIHSYSGKSSSEITFNKYDLVLTSGLGAIDKTKPDEIRTSELWKGSSNLTAWGIELHRRIALPFACIIFGVLGPALSNRVGRIGRLGGFSLSLSLLVLYYLLLITGESVTKTGKIPALIGGWMPNVFFGALAILFFYRAYRDKPIKKF